MNEKRKKGQKLQGPYRLLSLLRRFDPQTGDQLPLNRLIDVIRPSFSNLAWVPTDPISARSLQAAGISSGGLRETVKQSANAVFLSFIKQIDMLNFIYEPPTHHGT
ncbi:MAG TPA: hypothetical protein PKD64_14320 [Pirellulaceae bacterium]|nr:hypothetical protein [Pirellulaceae bacterium]HMO93362.1 hypothetical protein [Pirellulaceae bacterium]HMP71349.1 hypothetical protein [Pirellulaceae bacterium]